MNFQEQIAAICEKEYHVQPTKVETLDSLNNFVFKLTFDSRLPPVVLKILNRQTENFFLFRSEENEQLLKSKGYLASWILRETPEYRIERYINNTAITPDAFRQHFLRLLMTRHIALFHNLAWTKEANKVQVIDIWLNVLPQIRAVISENIKSLPRSDQEKIGQIIDHAGKFVMQDLTPWALTEELVLCHNDLQAANVLFDLDTNKLVLIDFEFVGFCFPATDLYNMLIESTYDYSVPNGLGFAQNMEFFPKEAELKEIIRFYIFFRQFASEFDRMPDLPESIERIKADPRLKAIDEALINRMYCSFFLLGSITNLCWSVWAFFFFKKESKAFDYVACGFQKYRNFLWALERHREINKPAHQK